MEENSRREDSLFKKTKKSGLVKLLAIYTKDTVHVMSKLVFTLSKITE